MKIKSLSFVLFITAASCAFTQTKRIAFKSHSGKTVDFKTALENHLFDIGDSNFGGPVYRYRLDTAIIISDTVVVSKFTAIPENSHADDTSYWRHYSYTHTDGKWTMGNESNDRIKKIMAEQHNYDVSNTQFIRYKLKKAKNQLKEKKGKKNLFFIFSGENDPMSGLMILLVGIILLLSLSTAWVSWKHNQWKEKILKS